MIYLELFVEFFKTGLFAIGGGLATLPFLSEMGERFGWFTSAELSRMIAIAESTPGPIGINCATYVGYEVGGILGSLIATLSLVMPSVIIIIIISSIMKKFSENRLVKDAFYGLRAGAVGLLMTVLISVCQTALLTVPGADFIGMISWKAVILFVVMLFAVLKWKKHPLIYIGSAAVIGIIFSF